MKGPLFQASLRRYTLLTPAWRLERKLLKRPLMKRPSTSRHHPQGHLNKTPWKRWFLLTRCPQRTRIETLSPWRKQWHNCVGPRKMKGPQPPLEPEVVIINMPAPAAVLPKDRDIEANKAGGDVDQTDGGDSDCQIVDENPQEAPRPKTPRPTPQGLWRLKKAKDTSVILQLVPHKEGESLPPTPGPSPPDTMKKWPTQDMSKIVVDRKEPTPTEENVDTCTSTQKEKQEKQD